jgi:hypothetical protein
MNDGAAPYLLLLPFPCRAELESKEKESKKKKKIWECIQQFRAGRQHIRPCKCNPLPHTYNPEQVSPMACRVDDQLRSSEWLFVWIAGEKKKRLATTTTT